MSTSGQRGFSLLEFVVVIACMGFLMAVLASRFGEVGDDAGVAIALEEMRHIKEAVRDGFFADLGLLPEDPGKDGRPASASCPSCGDDDRPWFASRYLCLQNDGEGNPEYEAMRAFLECHLDDAAALGLLQWDRYLQKGWRGPYMEQDLRAVVDEGEEAALPLVATPWAEKCEEMALEAEEQGRREEAEVLRRGKYYLILVDRDEDSGPIKESARIVSFGPDCADSGSYFKDHEERVPALRATAEDLRKLPGPEDDGSAYYDTGDDLVVFIFGGGAIRRPSF